MLCVSGSSGKINSYMKTGNSRLVSGQTLKILGFTFGTRPTAHAHLNAMLPKLRRRLWILSHLKNAGMKKTGLVRVYFSLIRPVAEFACVVYHTLLSEEQSAAIEKIQLRAFKIIYGELISYQTVLRTNGYKTMKERRTPGKVCN